MPASGRRPGMPIASQLILAFVAFALFLPLIGSKFVDGQIVKEQRMILYWFGQHEGLSIDQRAAQWFNAMAVANGMMAHMIAGGAKMRFGEAMKAIGPATKGSQGGAGSGAVKGCSSSADCATSRIILPASATGHTSSAQAPSPKKPSPAGHAMHRIYVWWITAVFALGYFALLRLSTLLAWLPILIPCLAAMLIQAGAERKLKWYSFGGINPKQYRIGVRLSMWMPAVAVALLFAPGALPPFTVALCIALACVGFSIVISHRPKPY